MAGSGLRLYLRFLAFGLIVLAASPVKPAERLVIEDNAGVDPVKLAAFERYAREVYAVANGFLEKQPDHPVTIEINDRRFGPRSDAGKSLIDMPASRLTGTAFTPRHWEIYRKRGTALLSSMIRVVGPRPYPGYAALLEIGLGTHLHAREFGRREPSWPDMGEPLTELLVRFLPELLPPCLRRFDRVAQTVSDRGSPFSVERIVAYAQAGTLVEFLLDEYGRSIFLELYNDPSATFETALGADMRTLEAGWLDWIRDKASSSDTVAGEIAYCGG